MITLLNEPPQPEPSVRAASAAIDVIVPGSDLGSILVKEMAKGYCASALPRMEPIARTAITSFLLVVALGR